MIEPLRINKHRHTVDRSVRRETQDVEVLAVRSLDELPGFDFLQA